MVELNLNKTMEGELSGPVLEKRRWLRKMW